MLNNQLTQGSAFTIQLVKSSQNISRQYELIYNQKLPAETKLRNMFLLNSVESKRGLGLRSSS